ncbi:MAG: GNAT family N-acetyltransferase [Kordiimonas sp.]
MTVDIANWQPCERPGRAILRGSYAVVAPLVFSTHGEDLFAAICGEAADEIWTYLPGGPYGNPVELEAMLTLAQNQHGWETMVIRCAETAEVLGMASYMRNREEHGSTEVGCVTFSKKLQRSRIATEAMYLMAQHVFDDLGYRRYEWKCNDLNAASKQAAIRFGFLYEGLFRNDMIRDGQSRDTAWYAMIDSDWPAVKRAFEIWLSPDNFDEEGLQRRKLADIRDE